MATHSAGVRRERVYLAPPSRAIHPIRYASLERTGYETVMARRQMRARPTILGALRVISGLMHFRGQVGV
jgi:hypothetical protein